MGAVVEAAVGAEFDSAVFDGFDQSSGQIVVVCIVVIGQNSRCGSIKYPIVGYAKRIACAQRCMIDYVYIDRSYTAG